MSKYIKCFLFTSVALSFLQLETSAMMGEKDQEQSSSVSMNPCIKAKRPLFITSKVGLMDDAIELDPQAPVEVMNKGYDMIKTYPHFEKNVVIKEADTGKITVITDYNNQCGFQLESHKILVKEGDIITIPYKITVHPGGRMAFGLFNTKRNAWYGGSENILGVGTHKGTYWKVVPKEETETSLVFRNFHQNIPGSTTFTIERLGIDIKKQSKK